MEVQLLTFYDIYCTTGYPLGHELLDQPKKKNSRVGERFFRNVAKEMEKIASRGKSSIQKNGVVRDLDRARPQNVFFIYSSRNDYKTRKKRKKFDVGGCWNEMALVIYLVTYYKHHNDHFAFCCFSLFMLLT